MKIQKISAVAALAAVATLTAIIALVVDFVDDDVIQRDQLEKTKTASTQEIEAVKSVEKPDYLDFGKERNTFSSEISTAQSVSSKTDAEVSTEKAKPSLSEAEEREITVMLWDLENDPQEPNDVNYDASYNGPFDEEIRLTNMDDECTENCAEVLTELMPAAGEHADQVNADALAITAKAEGLIDHSEAIPLVEPDPSSDPPVD